jgi:hypothetical protein
MWSLRLRTLLVGLLALTAAALVTPTAASAAPSCGITWGAQAKGPSGVPPAGGRLTDVRAGRHTCFDRLVLLVRGGRTPAYHVAYVAQVTQDPSGRPVPLRGGAFLQVTVGADGSAYRPADARNLVDVAGFPTLRQVAFAGSFEGLTTVGLGVRARLPFRVFTVGTSGGFGVVVDVAHRWS